MNTVFAILSPNETVSSNEIIGVTPNLSSIVIASVSGLVVVAASKSSIDIMSEGLIITVFDILSFIVASSNTNLIIVTVILSSISSVLLRIMSVSLTISS